MPRNIVQTAIDNFGRIDMVVNNAGILRDRIFHYMTPEEWDAVMKVHLYGAFYVSRAAVVHFRKQESGCYVHITSTSGLIGSVGQVNYGAAKLGIAGLSRCIAMDMQRYKHPLQLHRPARVQPHDRDGTGSDRGADEGACREDAARPYRTAHRVPGDRCGGWRIRADFRRPRQ